MLHAAPPPPPVLETNKPCFVSVQSAPGAYTTEPMSVSGTGFGAGGRLDLAVDGSTVLPGVTVAADGTLAAQTLSAPSIASGERRVAITATDPAAPGTVVARTRTRVTALGVGVRPKRARPQQSVRFTGRGFTAEGAVYAHYVRKGKLRRTVRLAAKPKGACGRFSVRRPQFPFRPKQGVWRIQIDQDARADVLTTDGPLVNLSVDVKRRPVIQP